MSDKIRPWESVRRRWQPESHVWDGMDSIPIETVRNEVLDLCDGIDAWAAKAGRSDRENDELRAKLEAVEARAKELEAWLVELGYKWDSVNWIPAEDA